MNRPRFDVAVSGYDRHQPLLDGRVRCEEIDLNVFTVQQGRASKEGRWVMGRHQRMLDHREFHACEFGLSPYIMAKSQGASLTAIPIFPRRHFSISNIYVNRAAGVDNPKDLRGKSVGLLSFQTTLSILGRADLQCDYGVPLDSVEWVSSAQDLVPLDPPRGIRVRNVDNNTLQAMFESGELAAMLVPNPPDAYRRGVKHIGRLFADSRAEEVAYYRRHGYWPVMHVIAVDGEAASRYPWALHALCDAFERAKHLCYSEFATDPNFSCLAWGLEAFEEQQALMGSDPWVNGVKANRTNLEDFLNHMQVQGLLPHRMAVDELFYPGLLET